MKPLLEYILKECEGAGIMATPGNTIGMGEPDMTDLVSAPAGGIPHEKIKIHRRKRKKKLLPEEPEVKMN